MVNGFPFPVEILSSIRVIFCALTPLAVKLSVRNFPRQEFSIPCMPYSLPCQPFARTRRTKRQEALVFPKAHFLPPKALSPLPTPPPTPTQPLSPPCATDLGGDSAQGFLFLACSCVAQTAERTATPRKTIRPDLLASAGCDRGQNWKV